MCQCLQAQYGEENVDQEKIDGEEEERFLTEMTAKFPGRRESERPENADEVRRSVT